MSNLWAVALAVFVINLPAGWFRARYRRLTVPWFLAIHLPVLPTFGIRVLAGVTWSLSTSVVLIGAFMTGQYLGDLANRRFSRQGAVPE